MFHSTSNVGRGNAFTPLNSGSNIHAVNEASSSSSRNEVLNSSSTSFSSTGHNVNAGRASLEEILYSQENIEKAISKVPEWDNPATAISHTEAYIRNAINSLRESGIQKPIVVIVGEAHISNAGTVAEMAAMNVLKNENQGGHAPLLLVENPPSSIAHIHGFLEKVEKNEIKTPATVSDIFADTPLKLPYLLAPCNPDREQRRLHQDRLLVKSGMAINAGFELHGFDKYSTAAKDNDEREEGMVEGVHDALGNGANMALLITGANHVKALHKALAEDVHLIMLSEAQHVGDLNSRTRRCMGYTLSSSDILNFRGSANLEGRDLSSTAYNLGLLPRPW